LYRVVGRLVLEVQRSWVEHMSFDLPHPIGKLQKSVRIDGGSAVEGEVNITEAGIGKLVGAGAVGDYECKDKGKEEALHVKLFGCGLQQGCRKGA